MSGYRRTQSATCPAKPSRLEKASQRLTNLVAGSRDERLERLLASIFMFDQLRSIGGGVDGADRFGGSIRQGHKISVPSQQLDSEPSMGGCRPQPIRLGTSSPNFRISGVSVLVPYEPQRDDSPAEFRDRPRVRTVSRDPFLPQSLIAGESLRTRCAGTLKHMCDSRSKQGTRNSDHAGKPRCHGLTVCPARGPSATTELLKAPPGIRSSA